jgi:hypothetical protein
VDPILVREYRSRWQAVAQVAIEIRWRKLNAILQIAVTLGLDLHTQNEDEVIVWQRWARLKAGSA